MLDLVSHGRVQFGIGEGATRLELGGFGIPAKRKRAMSLEAAREVADMMVMEPYPGYECEDWSLPCRNVLPKPIQKPHPPMWMACTNRDTIKVAAQNGLGVLAFSFLDPEEAKTWSSVYYDTIRSERMRAARTRGEREYRDGLGVLVARRSCGGIPTRRRRIPLLRIRAWARSSPTTSFPAAVGCGNSSKRGRPRERARQNVVDAAYGGAAVNPERSMTRSPGIGTPEEFRAHMHGFADAGVDQVIFLQQGGKNRHEHICESLERFHSDVLDDFAEGRERREQRKAEELAPYIEAALARRKSRAPLKDGEIPIVPASRPKPVAS